MKKIVKLVVAIIVLVSVLVPSGQSSAQDTTSLKVAIVQLVTHPSLDQITAGIKQSLKDNGYTEGENLTIDFQNAEGDMSVLPNISELVVSEQPDVIFAITTPVAQSLKEATTDIPIIMAGISDPVGANLVKSVDDPKDNGNITGVSDAAPLKEQIALIQSLNLDIKKIGMMYTTSEDNSKAEVEKAQKIAEEQGFEVIVQTIDTASDVQLVAENLASEVDAILVPMDNTIASSAEVLIAATNDAKIPVFPTFKDLVVSGGLASVAIIQEEIGKQSAEMAIKLFTENKSPNTMPVEFAKTTEKVFNSDAVTTLELSIPEDVLSTLTNVK